jgi:hypothetical protein
MLDCAARCMRRSAVEDQTDRSYGGGAALHGMLTFGSHAWARRQAHGRPRPADRRADARQRAHRHAQRARRRHPRVPAGARRAPIPFTPQTDGRTHAPETSAGSCRFGGGLSLDVSFASVLHTARKQPWTYHCCASAHHASARVSARERLQRAAPAGLLQHKLPSKRPSGTFRSNKRSFGVARCARR